MLVPKLKYIFLKMLYKKLNNFCMLVYITLYLYLNLILLKIFFCVKNNCEILLKFIKYFQ
jgi:hypothetical protein